MRERPRFFIEVYNSRPWYHDFSTLGVQTNFEKVLPLKVELYKWFKETIFKKKLAPLNLRGTQYVLNQKNKEEFILPYLQKAINLAQKSKMELSLLEMFCADGYYSFWVKKNFRDIKIVGVDKDKEDIERCFIMNKILNFSDISFKCDDVFNIKDDEQYDIVLCCGGLYHLSNPIALLKKCYNVTKKFLIVQSVVTMETDSPTYFISPAPGWQHGCRFTDSWLRNSLEKVGWIILDHAKNELTGNERIFDRGASYYLCTKK